MLMCYVVFLSTTSPEDLTVHDTELMRFERELGNEQAITLPENPHRWYVASKVQKAVVVAVSATRPRLSLDSRDPRTGIRKTPRTSKLPPSSLPWSKS
jgi:hypothetical protein